MYKLYLITLTLSSAIGFSQSSTGSISGVVLDQAYNNEPLAFATVIIRELNRGTTTDVNGKFRFKDLSSGSYTLTFSFVGYKPEELTNIKLIGGQSQSVSIILKQNNQLKEVVINAVANKESEQALLTEQKDAIQMQTAIGANEISKKGLSNIASALAKTVGINKQEGSGNLYVRGLGDRYNITTVNGLPIPSNNPQTKNIDLSILPTDIVQNIAISKTYNSENFADFSGANINILSKIHQGAARIKVSAGAALNSNVSKENKFYLQPNISISGFYNKSYNPDVLKKYTFDTWDNTEIKNPFNKNIKISAGKTFHLGNTRLNAFVTALHNNSYSYEYGISRGSINAQGVIFTDLKLKHYSYKTNTTAMANLLFRINSNHNLQFNSIFINSSNQFNKHYDGNLQVFDKGEGLIRFSGFDRTALIVNQLLGHNKLTDNLSLKWAVGYNVADNKIPNRRLNTLVYRNQKNLSAGLIPSTQASSENNRFYQNLNENELATNIFLKYYLGSKIDKTATSSKNKITIGHSFRYKKVGFEVTQFNLKVDKTASFPNLDINNLDAFFNQVNMDLKLFDIITFRGDSTNKNALKPQTYNGFQNIQAFFGDVQYDFSDKFTLIGGLRSEFITQSIAWKTQLDPSGDTNNYKVFQFLPYLSLKYKLNNFQNLKVAASKTYTLPQFKERAPFQFEYITNIEFGNPNLYASTNYNADIKWEFFPKKKDEIISATVFWKYIQNPINKVVIASSTNDLSFLNTGKSATILGIESNLKKRLFNITDNQNINFGFNIALMYTNQDFDNKKVTNETSLSVFFTENNGSLTGASPLLINADISYNSKISKYKTLLATLSYNYFSDQLSAIGISGVKGQINKGFGTLNFILRYQMFKGFNINLSTKNILNPIIESVQQNKNVNDVLLSSYNRGVTTGLSMSYSF